MKYIKVPGDDAIQFGRYAAYIAGVRDRFPEAIRSLVSESRYYDLSSAESLHDAHLVELTISEMPVDDKGEIPSSVRIQICLNGPRRKMKLEYRGVTRYVVRGENDFGYFDSFHSDLYTHEFRIEEGGAYIHEIAFVTASSIEISFQELAFSQEEYEEPA